MNGLKPGQRQNVRLPGYPPMVREITRVEERGGWRRWYWKAEQPTPEGRFDCGYSGITIALLLAFFLAPFAARAQTTTVTGACRVIDGDSLEIAGQRVRLHGIDAPELSQTCQRKGSPYHCGAVSLVRLEELINGRPVTCTPIDRDRWERVVARCFVGQPHIDLGGWLVRNGLAVAYTRYSRDYLSQESVARGARLGIWSGEFVQPSEWRRGKR